MKDDYNTTEEFEELTKRIKKQKRLDLIMSIFFLSTAILFSVIAITNNHPGTFVGVVLQLISSAMLFHNYCKY